MDLHQEFASAPHPHPLQVLNKMYREQQLCWTLYTPQLHPDFVHGNAYVRLNLCPRELTPWPGPAVTANGSAAAASASGPRCSTSTSSSFASSSAAAAAHADRAARYQQFVAALDPLCTGLSRFIRGTWKSSIGRFAQTEDPDKLSAFQTHPAEVIPTHQLVRAHLGIFVVNCAAHGVNAFWYHQAQHAARLHSCVYTFVRFW